MIVSRAFIFARLLVLALMVWPETAPGDIAPVALVGDSTGDPAPLGGAFSSFYSDSVINSQGTVLFRAAITDSTSQFGIYIQQAAVRTKVARKGDAVEGGGTFSSFIPQPVLNAAGQVSFSASVAGSSYGDAVFFWNGADPPAAIAATGDAAPPSQVEGGTLYVGGVRPAMAGSQIAFGAGISNSASREGVFRWPGSNPLTAVARHNDLLLDGFSGKFSREEPNTIFGRPAVNAAGQAAFTASVGNTDSNSGVFRSATDVVAMENRAAPGTSGLFSYFYAPVINAGGDVAFAATVRVDASNLDTIYVTRQGTLALVAKDGDAAPGTGGQFTGFLHGKVVLNDAGQAAYHASYAVGAQSAEGVFRSEANGAVTPIGLMGQAVPEVGTYAGFDLYPDMNNRGQVLFSALVTTPDGDKWGAFLSDGVDTVAVAMTGQEVAPGFVATSVDFAGRSDVNRGGRSALNDAGQVAVNVGTAGSMAGVFLFTPDLNWRHDPQGVWHDGAWEQTQYWTFGFQPGPLYAVDIRPVQPVTITGPAAPVTVKSLQLSDACGGSPHLNLSGGGTLTVSGNAIVKAGGKVTLAPGSGLEVLGQLEADGGEFVYDGGALSVSDNVLRVTGGAARLNADLGSSTLYRMEVRADNAGHVDLAVSQHLAALLLDGDSTATLSAGDNQVVAAKALTLTGGAAPTATLDVATGYVVVNYEGDSPAAAIGQWIAAAAGPGQEWTNAGITSSVVAQDSSTYGVGCAENNRLLVPYNATSNLFRGEAVADNAVILGYTLLGDLDMNGVVDGNDVSVFLLNYSQGEGFGWWEGDIYGHDGKVDGNDVTFFLLNYGSRLDNQVSGMTPAPEPAALALLASGIAAVLARRRGRRRAAGV